MGWGTQKMITRTRGIEWEPAQIRETIKKHERTWFLNPQEIIFGRNLIYLQYCTWWIAYLMNCLGHSSVGGGRGRGPPWKSLFFNVLNGFWFKFWYSIVVIISKNNRTCLGTSFDSFTEFGHNRPMDVHLLTLLS